jgi:ribose transport system substrate-binding protein
MKPPVRQSGSQSKYEVQSLARGCDILAAFHEPGEVLELRDVSRLTGLNKVTVFRLLATLVGKNLIERSGPHGYRSRFRPLERKRFRIGYAEQSTVVPFISTVTESLKVAAAAAEVDLVILNNRASETISLRNVGILIGQKVDLVIEFQGLARIAGIVAERFAGAGIPLIAVDNPHPGAIYFGADNYRAGHLGGEYLGRWAAVNWHGQVDGILVLAAETGGPVLEARLLGVLDGLFDALPNLSGVPKNRCDTGKGRFAVALDLVRKYIKRNPGRHILVTCVNDPTALGALEAFRECGREADCAILGQDGVAESRRELRRPGSRLVASVAYFPETYGERLVPLALDILHKRPAPPAVLTRHRLLTPANVDRIYSNDLLMSA